MKDPNEVVATGALVATGGVVVASRVRSVYLALEGFRGGGSLVAILTTEQMFAVRKAIDEALADSGFVRRPSSMSRVH